MLRWLWRSARYVLPSPAQVVKLIFNSTESEALVEEGFQVPESQEPSGIYGLNVATGELKRVSDLPGPSYNTAYEGATLMHYVRGRLHILWPDGNAGDGQYRLYSIDPVLGTIEEQP